MTDRLYLLSALTDMYNTLIPHSTRSSSAVNPSRLITGSTSEINTHCSFQPGVCNLLPGLCVLLRSAVRPTGLDKRNSKTQCCATTARLRLHIACSHRRHRQDKTVLSCPCRRCEHNWRQDKIVLSCIDPVSNLQLFNLKYIEDYWKLGNWKLDRDETKLIEIGSRQDKAVLS